MPGMRAAHCGYSPGVAANRQPVHQLGSDRSAFASTISGIGWSRAAGDDQHHPRALRMGEGQSVLQSAPRRVKRMAVQIEREVRRHRAFAQAAIPVGV